VKKLAAVLPNLSYAGFVQPKQATELLRSASILLLPSRWQEPGSIAALEAMAVGTPVVAFRSGGLAEYVHEAAAGRVVEPGVDTMRKACVELLGSRSSWDACSAAGRRAAREIHSVDRYLDRIEAIYRGVCAPRHNPRADP
jgi:glycosyltransferase involved in cell wall biosynthesis